MPTDEAYVAFQAVLSNGGLRDALVYLVGLSAYRFIAIFRFDQGMANAAVYYDREDPEQRHAAEVPEGATYCSLVRDSRGAFATADAAADCALRGHIAKDTVAAYCGIPIMTPEGEVLGTLCQYDLVPRDPESLELELLVRAASAIERSGKIRPYPK